MGFFSKLFGIKASVESALGQAAGVATSAAATSARAAAAPSQGTSPFNDVAWGKKIQQLQGAMLIEDPDDGERRWVNTWKTEMHPSQWADEWGPVQPRDIDTFWHHKTEFEMLLAGEPEQAAAKVQSFGYRDVGHFYQVEITFRKHHGVPHSPGDDTLDMLMWDPALASKAAMAGAMRYHQDQQAQAMAANPELMAPVEGIDLDTYAKVAAASASGLAQDQLHALLGQHGMDMAKWQRVNGAWTDRMSKDTSGAIAMAYSKAFAGSGAGQYGAAAQAGAAVLGGGSVQAAAGAEPMPFERYCEIQGAMTAWSNTGQDVNAMLKHTFNMNALDFSNVSMWWMSHMQSDLSYFDRHSQLTEKYEAQYSAGAPAGADDDLTF